MLGPPSVAVHASFLEAMGELVAEGAGDELRLAVERWRGIEAFAAYVDELRAQGDENTMLPAGAFHATHLWYTDGAEYVGRLSIRREPLPWVVEVGGHIGYDVRPSQRRRGHATAMLGEALPVARGMGIDPVVITCDAANVASRIVIERNGGRLEDRRSGKLRFLV